MALNSLFCADVPLSNYSLTHSDFLSALKATVTEASSAGAEMPTFENQNL